MWKTVMVSVASVVLTLLVIVGVAYAADIFTVDKDGTVRLVITDTGNVGIGATSPAYKLDVSGEVRGTGTFYVGGHSVISNADPYFRTDADNKWVVLSGGSGWTTSGATLVMRGASAVFNPGGAEFRGADGAVRKFTFGNCNVGIGGDPDQLFSVNGNASKVGGGSWATYSDDRLKRIDGAFDAGLKEVLQLRPIRYHYRNGNPLDIPDEREHIGFSAQEVEKVIPEAVSTNGRGYRMVENDPILWAMLNAIKEQQAVLTKAMSDLDRLKAENDSLKSKVETLEKK